MFGQLEPTKKKKKSVEYWLGNMTMNPGCSLFDGKLAGPIQPYSSKNAPTSSLCTVTKLEA